MNDSIRDGDVEPASSRPDLPPESLDPLFSIRPGALRHAFGDPVGSDEPTLLVDPTETEPGTKSDTVAPSSRYRLLSELGRGGMGVVYRARQERLGREVAVKTIRADRCADPAVRHMFSSEARIAGFLDHPNIVPVHELEDGDLGELFMAMKLVDGRSWHEAIGAGDVAQDRHLEILLSVSNAVAFAHSHGFIHRDLKPSNVMIGEFGEVLVMDWGLAVSFREPPSGPDGVPVVGDVDTVAGTLRYMAPEMAMPRGNPLGPWSDIYLLGSILFHVLAGRPPHEGATPDEVVDGIVGGRVSELPQDAPAELAAACRRAMAPDPAARYPEVAAFQKAIQDYRSHRESRVLATHASEELENAERLSGNDGDRTAFGRAYQQSIGGFEQAMLLWPENGDAAEGLHRARLSYARAARDAGDLALAAAQLDGLVGAESVAMRASVDEAVASRERAVRTTRRLRRTAVGALLFIVVGLVIGTVILDNERTRADSAADRARSNARRWREALDDVRRLSDVQVLGDLVRRRDALWPIGPATIAGIGEWIDEADALQSRLSDHQRALKTLRQRALEPTEAHRRAAFGKELARRERLREMAAAYEAVVDADDRRARHLLKELESIEEQIGDIDEATSQGHPWAFEDQVDQWNHDVLAGLVTGIEALHRDDGPADEMRERGRRARELEQVTVVGQGDAWASAAREVAADERFAGLRLKPQVGLVPLGKDTASGLQEFLHWPTHADTPLQRDASGRLSINESSGLVLVLVPAGKVRLGPRPSSNQKDLEGPAHDVELAPFFVSKFEMNQAQWMRFTGTNPSFYHPEFKLRSGVAANALHPVEQVSWTTSHDVLRKLGLRLPTEAQWEYVARAGTDSAWWTGEDRETLKGAANIADATARDAQAPWPTLADWPEYRDGFAAHAPVTALRPNGFGLHNVHGNVWEWCRDAHGVYHYPVRQEDGERLPARAHARVLRGGGFTDAVSNTRSGKRSYEVPDYQANDLGVRPVRRLDR